MTVVAYRDEQGAEHFALVTRITRREGDAPLLSLAYVDESIVDASGHYAISRIVDVDYRDNVNQSDDEDAPRVPYWQDEAFGTEDANTDELHEPYSPSEDDDEAFPVDSVTVSDLPADATDDPDEDPPDPNNPSDAVLTDQSQEGPSV